MKPLPKFLILLFLSFYSLITLRNCDAELPGLTLHFIDVGEGDSAILESKKHLIVVDSGNYRTAPRVVDYLERLKKPLYAVLITHPHPDHIGALPFLSAPRFFDNGQLISAEDARTKGDIVRWYDELRVEAPDYKALSDGDSFKVDDLTISVLSPSKKPMSSDWNTNSLVFRVTYGEFSALFMGDANLEAEKTLLEAHRKDLSAVVLKVGHHGADDATSNDFLTAVTPKVSVVSVNKNNVRGYPSPLVVEKLTTSTKMLDTSRVGSLQISARKNGSYVVTTRP